MLIWFSFISIYSFSTPPTDFIRISKKRTLSLLPNGMFIGLKFNIMFWVDSFFFTSKWNHKRLLISWHWLKFSLFIISFVALKIILKSLFMYVVFLLPASFCIPTSMQNCWPEQNVFKFQINLNFSNEINKTSLALWQLHKQTIPMQF